MMKKTVFYTLPLVAFTVPSVAFAAGQKLSDIINTIIGYLNQALFLLLGVAVVIFVFYVIKYYMMADANRADGGKYVMYSLIGFFVILSFWGLVNILQNTFGLQNENNQPTSWTSFKNLFPGGGGYTNSPGGSTNNFINSPGGSTNNLTNSPGGSTNNTRTFGGNPTTADPASYGQEYNPTADPCPNGSGSGPNCQ